MARSSVSVSPTIGLWSSVESAVSLTLKSLSMAPADQRAFVEFTEAQERIRRSGRHWLIG